MSKDLSEYGFFLPARGRSAPRLQKHFSGEGRTKQSFKSESNINNIVARYGLGALAINAAQQSVTFGDATIYGDYHSSVNKVIQAEDSFMSLPANVRKKFDNDPGKFVEFCLNPDTPREEFVKLGLALEPEAPSELPKSRATEPKANEPKNSESTVSSTSP